MTDVFDVRAPAWQRRIVVALLAASFAAGAVGNALTPVLLRESPIALLAVHASYAQMALTSARIDPVTFVALVALRRFVGELVFFAGGRVLGAELLAWYADRRGKPLRLPNQLNHRWWPVRDAAIVALPNPAVSAFFGAVRVPWWRFTVLKLVGSVVTVAAMRSVLDNVRGVEKIADFVEANAVVITVIGLLAAFGWWRWQRRTRDSQAT